MRSPSRTSIVGPWIGDLGVFIAVFDASLMMESACYIAFQFSFQLCLVRGTGHFGVECHPSGHRPHR